MTKWGDCIEHHAAENGAGTTLADAQRRRHGGTHESGHKAANGWATRGPLEATLTTPASLSAGNEKAHGNNLRTLFAQTRNF